MNTVYTVWRERNAKKLLIETGYWVQLLQSSGYRYWLSMTGYFNIQVTGYWVQILGTVQLLLIYKTLWQHAHFLCARDCVQPQNLSHYLKVLKIFFFFNGETCWNPWEKTIQYHTPPVHPSSLSKTRFSVTKPTDVRGSFHCQNISSTLFTSVSALDLVILHTCNILATATSQTLARTFFLLRGVIQV